MALKSVFLAFSPRYLSRGVLYERKLGSRADLSMPELKKERADQMDGPEVSSYWLLPPLIKYSPHPFIYFIRSMANLSFVL